MRNIVSLKNSREFGEVYNNGKSYANKYLVMYVKDNNLGINRLGISVSKKVGNSVVRHRVTRLIRESYRMNSSQIVEGKDIIIIARASAKEEKYWNIESAFLHLMRLHHILDKTV